MQEAQFGEFIFNFEQLMLWRGGVPLTLGSRTTRLLDYLLRHRGEIVPKATLIAAAWGDAAVEDSNLSVQIATLRRMLGKDSTGRDWIITVERVGYRFLPATRTAAPAPSHDIPMLEVGLTIEGTGGQMLAEQATDETIAVLSLFSSLRLCRRGDMRLPPDYRLTGSVSSSGNGNVRVRLLYGESGAALWATSLGNNAGDLLWPRIAAEVEARVHMTETQRSLRLRPDSNAPYDLYLRARALIRMGEHQANARAFALLLQALEVEPESARLLAAAAETLHTRKLVGWPPLTGRDQELRLDFARRAWAAAEGDAYALSLAGNAMFTSGEPDLGLVLTEAAAELNPNDPAILACAGHSHIWIGAIDDARRYYERAIALAPHAAETRFAYSSLATVYNISDQPEEALATARRGIGISASYTGLHWQTLVAHMKRDDGDAARRHFAAYRLMHPEARLGNIRHSHPYESANRVAPLIETLGILGMPE